MPLIVLYMNCRKAVAFSVFYDMLLLKLKCSVRMNVWKITRNLKLAVQLCKMFLPFVVHLWKHQGFTNNLYLWSMIHENYSKWMVGDIFIFWCFWNCLKAQLCMWCLQLIRTENCSILLVFSLQSHLHIDGFVSSYFGLFCKPMISCISLLMPDHVGVSKRHNPILQSLQKTTL